MKELNFIQILQDLDACLPALEYVENEASTESFNKSNFIKMIKGCNNPNWFSWLFKKLNLLKEIREFGDYEAYLCEKQKCSTCVKLSLKKAKKLLPPTKLWNILCEKYPNCVKK